MLALVFVLFILANAVLLVAGMQRVAALSNSSEQDNAAITWTAATKSAVITSTNKGETHVNIERAVALTQVQWAL